MRKREEGAGGALIAVILVLIALVIVAVSSMNRTASANADRDQTITRLATASAALESYAGVQLRLPCPANPTVDTGVEVPNGVAGCQFGAGTLPWKTIGMRRDDSFDSWGRKISYRVYTGNAGSLTQPGGASMANCDTFEAFPGGATPTAGNSGGLCRPDPPTSNPADRTTTPAQFLAGKGLTLTDFGTVHNDVAYVLISHGVTGLGSLHATGSGGT
jgi:type II secretory pathway pseudopilin PulG